MASLMCAARSLGEDFGEIMRKLFITALCFAPATLLGTAAGGQTLTFEDLTPNLAVPGGYGGVNWDNFYALDTYGYNASGYLNGAVSPDIVLYNGGGNPASISGTGFILTSGYFTAAWNNGLTMQVEGFVGGVSTYSTSFTIDATGPTLEMFGWANLSSVTFTSFGGDPAGYDGIGPHFALDNLTIRAAPAPELTSWVMMLGGLGMVGGAMRSRGKIAVRFA